MDELRSHSPEYFYRVVARYRARRQRRGLWVVALVLAYFVVRVLAG